VVNQQNEFTLLALLLAKKNQNQTEIIYHLHYFIFYHQSSRQLTE